jgi:hypothetical protein
MNMAEQALETARSVFMAHKFTCKTGCKNFKFNQTATLAKMCLQGTQLYKALLKAEDTIVKNEKAKADAKIERAMRREAMKQMQP